MDAESKGNTNDSSMDLRTVAKGSIIQFVGTGINRGSGLLFTAIAIRLLGAPGFGVYRQIAQLLKTTSMISTMGFDSALLRSVAQARARGELGAIRSATRTAVVTVFLVSLLLLFPFVFAADPISGAFADTPSRRNEMAFLLRLGAAFIPVFALAKVLGAGAMGFKTVVPAVLVENVLQPVSFLFFATAAIAVGYGVGGAVGGLLASSPVALLAAGWFYWRLIPREEAHHSPVASLRSMARFALPRAGDQILKWGTLGTLIVGILGTDLDVALFAVATALQGIVWIFPQAFLSIWKPIVVDLVERQEMERLGTLYQTVNRWVASGSFGFIIALLVFPEPFVRILGGETVQGAAPLTSVIALGTLVQVGTGLCGMLVMMAGYPFINLLNSLGVTSFYILAAWYIVPTHGAFGMAVVHAAAAALANLVLVVMAKRLTGLQPFGRSFLKPITASFVAGIVLATWRVLIAGSMSLDLIGLFVAAILYCGSLWVTGMDAEDRIVYERLRVRLRAFFASR